MGQLTEWLQLMLAEIASRQQAARAAEAEDARRRGATAGQDGAIADDSAARGSAASDAPGARPHARNQPRKRASVA
ncbi:MAG TPA: hypothetical protein VHX52_12410 [Steroidobacteraceae bacterium]|jgi:hypothetical protein|nr:hypothetical protein [Steroidobacteraceae bacterium]